MKKIRVAIQGFGRIGRRAARLLLEDHRFEWVGINDIADTATLAHLFRFDSIHGRLNHTCGMHGDHLEVDGRIITVTHAHTPEHCDWASLNVDWVLECSGKFKDETSLQGHLTAGAKRVLLSVPPDDDRIPMVVYGISNIRAFTSERIISNASCTTNNAAPMIAVIDECWGIESCYITTVHSYTTDQRLVDSPHRDWRRSRSAMQSIIPTSTGAAKAITRIFPHLSNAIGGCGMRVPIANGSLTDITCMVRAHTSAEDVNEAFISAAHGLFSGIMEYTKDPIVSADVIGNTHSCIFDSQLTSVIGKMIKVVGWYDNESGYSKRMLDIMLELQNV
ncbi:MAG: type I glyceraldehyde-3-phosphate dehydrogenase [Flavobacteriales bacterium]